MTELRKKLRELAARGIRSFRSRTVWVCLLTLSLAGTVFYVSQQTKTVYIRDGEDVTLRYTLKQEPEQILKESGIKTMSCDVVDFSGFESKMGVISIKRAFEVKVTVDGSTKHLMTTEMTVGELLEKNHIDLGPEDILSKPKEYYLNKPEHITIQRVQTTTTTVEEVIPFETVYKENSLIGLGRVRQLSAGRQGKRVLTYEDRVVDGVVQERRLVSDKVVQEPVDKMVLRGTQNPVSPLDFGVEQDDYGRPLTYKKVLTDQVATGYSARKGARGASGMKLSEGYVAVRSDQIPYGTKLYIESADREFVYGYAIAADTGSGLVNGVIDVDLFYDSYDESCLNSRRLVNIYIIG